MTASKIKRAHVGFEQGGRVGFAPNTHHQSFAGRAATHMSSNHKTHAAHHAAFKHVAPSGKDFSDARDNGAIDGHG